MENILSPERSMRVLTVGVSAMLSLYLLAAFVAEPMRGFAATDEDGKVSLTITATAATLECNDSDTDSNGDNENLVITGATVTLGSDTGRVVHSEGSDAYITCNVQSNNYTGYTLGWRVSTGRDGFGTGYMVSENADTIAPYGYEQGDTANVAPKAWTTGEVTTNQAEWGARLSSASSAFGEVHGSDTLGTAGWGNDSLSDQLWARIASGATFTTFASATTATSDAGDDHYIGFRVEIDSDRQQPTGTYEVEVDFETANDT